MLKWETVERARMADGSEFVLASHDGDWVVRVDDRILMTNRVHDSEITLAEEALDRVDEPSHVLVGGLGLGYTLRAVLDLIGEDAAVTVAELVPELVEWNRKYVGGLNEHPLEDRRCRVAVGDVFDLIKRSPREFDAILLDVDNGPRALAQAKNQRIYGDGGVQACLDALVPGGVLAVWSGNDNARYAQRLRRFADDVEVLHVAARAGSRGKHVIFLARRR